MSGFIDFMVTYFTSQVTEVTLAVAYSAIFFLLVLFEFDKRRPQRRLQTLFALFLVSLFAWSFLATSLLFCRGFMGLYVLEDGRAVGVVFGYAILASLAFALPLSAIVTYEVPGAITRRLSGELLEAEGPIAELAARAARSIGVTALNLLQSPSSIPFAYSVGGDRGLIVVSKGLVNALDEDEAETVVAHELAHLRNNDTRMNTLIAVYRRVLFFDPFMRLLEGAVYSEKEFAADDLSARSTRKPLSLASALLKISSANVEGGGGSPARVEGLSILGTSRVLRPPGVRERIERLMALANELEFAVPR